MSDCSTITHIAGLALNVGGRVIQRCQLCGAKLRDSEGEMVLASDEHAYGTWPVGRLVQVEAGNPTRYSLLPEVDQLPEDSCLEFA